MAGVFKEGTKISLDGLITKKVRLERRIDHIFHEFRVGCEHHIPPAYDQPRRCIHKDNGELIETMGGGYFACSVDDCPLRHKI